MRIVTAKVALVSALLEYGVVERGRAAGRKLMGIFNPGGYHAKRIWSRTIPVGFPPSIRM